MKVFDDIIPPMRIRIPAVLAAILSTAVLSCSTSPITGKEEFLLVPPETEAQMGIENARAVLEVQDPYPDPGVQRTVERVGRRIVPHTHLPNLPYTFHVIASPKINAFTTGGGQIFIYTGLLERLKSEAELAAVIAHEIGHSSGRHIAKKVQTSLLISLGAAAAGTAVKSESAARSLEAALGIVNLFARGYSRDHEREADDVGAVYMAKAGYDPEGMADTFRLFLDLSAGKGEASTGSSPTTRRRPRGSLGWKERRRASGWRRRSGASGWRPRGRRRSGTAPRSSGPWPAPAKTRRRASSASRSAGNSGTARSSGAADRSRRATRRPRWPCSSKGSTPGSPIGCGWSGTTRTDRGGSSTGARCGARPERPSFPSRHREGSTGTPE